MKKPLMEMKPGDHTAQKIECLGVILMNTDEIAIGERRRPIREDGVATLMESIVDVGGILDPIKVRSIRGDGARMELIDGLQRLEAAKRIGLPQVPVAIWTGPASWAAQVEVSSNLARAHLDGVELAFFLYDSRELYFERYPTAQTGKFKGNQHTGSLVGTELDLAGDGALWGPSASKPPSLIETLALIYGKSRATLFNLLKAGGSIPKHRRKDVLALEERPSMASLIALAGVDEEAKRDRIISVWLDGGQTLDAAMEKVLGAKDVVPPAQKIALGVRSYWDQCHKRQRREFIKDNLDEVRALVAEIDGEDA
ncbi:MAG: ParB/RepB/Spo0J family partition protein [Shimia sp.]